MLRRVMPLTLAGTLLAGCQPLTPDRNAAMLMSLQPARYCEPYLPFFGHYQHIGERTAATLFQPADGQIAMRNDGGWCTIRHAFAYHGTVLTPPMVLIIPPQHGNVVLGAIDGELRLAYQPNPGYVGPDAFKVRLESPVPEMIPVRVNVQP